jgi:TFIIF-interacting CTD phosphatase-like protein
MSSRRGYNESTNGIIMGTGNSNNDLFLSSQAQQQQQHNSSNVKRNNFLSLLNNQIDDN